MPSPIPDIALRQDGTLYTPAQCDYLEARLNAAVAELESARAERDAARTERDRLALNLLDYQNAAQAEIARLKEIIRGETYPAANDGPGAVEQESAKMRLLANNLGLGTVASAMHFSACRSLETLDDLVTSLSILLHGYEVGVERVRGQFVEETTRRAMNDLRTEITNYQQRRLNSINEAAE